MMDDLQKYTKRESSIVSLLKKRYLLYYTMMVHYCLYLRIHQKKILLTIKKPYNHSFLATFSKRQGEPSIYKILF